MLSRTEQSVSFYFANFGDRTLATLT